MDPDLSNVRVPSVLVVRDHSNLDHESTDRFVAHVLDRDHHPPGGLIEVDYLDLLQVVEVRARPNRDAAGRVALVQFVVRVNVDLVDGRLSLELNVDQMRQLAIRLPIRVHAIVSQLLNPKAWIGKRGGFLFVSKGE